MTKISYKFLNYKICASEKKLMRKSTEIPVRPKTLATLLFLLRNAARAVSKEEILDAIWPASEVQDQAVFQSISELRSIFKGLDCIETVRGTGYRWTIPLDPIDVATDSRMPRWGFAAATILMLVVGSVVWWQIQGRTPSFSVMVSSAKPLGSPIVHSSETSSTIDKMLIQQLRRMGLDAQLSTNSPHNANQFEVEIESLPVDKGVFLRYRLRGHSTIIVGELGSTNPLGVVRDLAIELHDSISVMSVDKTGGISISALFTRAKEQMDKGDFSLASAYLQAALAESPNQKSLQRALAYSYHKLRRVDDALAIATKMYALANEQGEQTDLMLSAIMLSQLHLRERNIDAARMFAIRALDLATKLNDLLIVGEAQEQLGEISIIRGDVADGREQLAVALNYFKTFCPAGEIRVSERLHDLES